MNTPTQFRLKKIIFACAILSCMPFAAYAATDNTTETEIKSNTKTESHSDKKAVETLEVVGSMAKTGTVKFYDTKSTDSVDEQKISENGDKKVDDALSYVSGVINTTYGKDGRSNWLRIRGLDVSYTLDGMPQFKYSYFGSTPEIFGLEKIEVLKGTSSELYGSSNPGGTVNMITKRPEKSPEGEVNLFYGNSNQVGIGADYSGLITDKIKYRIVGEYRDEDGQQTGTGIAHYYFASSLTWDINDKTSLTLLTSYQTDHGVPENGFYFAYGTLNPTSSGYTVNRNTFYGSPDDKFNREVSTLGYELRHIFDNGMVFTQNYKFVHQDLDLLSAYAFSVDKTNNQYTRLVTAQTGINNTHTIDNRLTKDFELGKWKDTLLVGLDYMNTNMQGVNGQYNATPVNIANPDTSSNLTKVDSGPFQLSAYELGVYAQNQIVYDDKLIFNQGARYSWSQNDGYWYNYYSANPNKLDNFEHTYSDPTYNAGVMYVFDNNISPYINYSQSFQPVYGYDSVAKDVYKPLTASQWESGIKYEPTWMDGSFTFAYFNITSQNSFYSRGASTAGQALETRGQGAELQMNANLRDNMNVNLAYTYTNSETDVNSSLTTQTAMIPKHATSAWVNYRFDGILDGLSVGTGLRYIGDSKGLDTNNTVLNVPSFLLWDAMAKYQFNKSWYVQLNATNITDKVYVAGCSYWCYYGAERSVVATLNYKF